MSISFDTLIGVRIDRRLSYTHVAPFEMSSMWVSSQSIRDEHKVTWDLAIKRERYHLQSFCWKIGTEIGWSREKSDAGGLNPSRTSQFPFLCKQQKLHVFKLRFMIKCLLIMLLSSIPTFISPFFPPVAFFPFKFAETIFPNTRGETPIRRDQPELFL